MLLFVLAAPSSRSTAQRQPDPNTRQLVGQVRSDDDGATLLRRVRVTMQGGAAAETFTDSEGRFQIALPASGSFTLRFAKAGFAALHLASTRIPPVGAIDIRLARGAAIVGRVVDDSGAPVTDVAVRVRSTAAAAIDVPVNVGTQTDDQGEFRVGSLPAGRYQVSVQAATQQFVAAATGNLLVVRSSPLSPSQRTGTADDASAATLELRRGDEAGVTLFHDADTFAVNSATSYAAGFTAGSGAAERERTTSREVPGTAVVSGRVTGPNGRVIAGAIVRLVRADGGTTGTRVSASDSRGEYQFMEVRAGSYRVSATRTGFIAAEYGEQHSGQPGTVITLRDRQRVDRVDVVLPRGAVIAGTVSDAEGEPIEGLGMHVWRLHTRGGRRVAESVSGVPNRRTDDRGRYRISGLPPGAYYVVAAEDSSSPSSPGIIYDLPGVRRSYYPGVPTLSQAAVVRVAVGVDAPAADVTFLPADSFRVTGTALDARGQPVRSPVALAVSERSDNVLMPAQVVSPASNGAFEFLHVPPGDYVLQVAVRPAEFALARVTVSGADVGPLRVQTSAMAAVTGRVVLKGDPGVLLPQSFLVTSAPADADYQPVDNLRMTPTVRVNSDWSFEARGLAGPLRFISPSPPRGWWLESVTVGGINAADEPVQFATADDSRADVDVVFANTAAEVSGRVVDSRGQPVAAFVAVAIPVDRDRWYSGSRYLKTAAAQEGRFTLASLPPGDYSVAAVEALSEVALQDLEVLATLSTRGRRVTLSGSERLVTDLSLVGLPASMR